MKYTAVLWIVVAIHFLSFFLPRSFESIILFNSLAFQDPTNSSNIITAFESFIHVKEPHLGSLSRVLNDTLTDLGYDVDVSNSAHVGGKDKDKFTTAMHRMALFAAPGLPDVHINVSLTGCNTRITSLPRTADFEDRGVVSANVSIGSCYTPGLGSSPVKLAATALGAGNLPITSTTGIATIYHSPPNGFGIVSDIDDTIKISDVLNGTKLIENTLFNDADPVPGMPELYASLAQSLTHKTSSETIPPQFIYVSGSPIQLYPFLTSFIETKFTSSLGPVLLQNFSFTDDPSLIMNSFGDGRDGKGSGNGKIEYKVRRINSIHGIYPTKSFLMIGDSTEKDPEIYGRSYNIHGPAFVRCIWIHVVEGANNTDARFAAAFKGVPKEKIRLYRDVDIPGLRKVDVKGGKC